MSKCDLSIHLANPDRRYRPGEAIEGEVRVLVDEDCACHGLSLERYWRTHGRGNRAQGESETDILFTGDWRAGERARYPFSIPAPSGPASYHGHLLNVDWYLRARADIPWAIDPKDEQDFLLEVPADSGGASYFAGPAFQAPQALLRAQRKSRGCAPVVGAVLMAVGAVFIFVVLHEGGALPFALLPGIFVIIGAALAIASLWNRFAQQKLGSPAVTIEPLRPSPGATVQAEVCLAPRAHLAINRVTLSLQAREVVVSGSGTRKTTHRHTAFESTRELALGSPEVHRGEQRRLQGSLAIPADAPFTFAARENTLAWQVLVQVDVARWPDWREAFPIAVLPAGSSVER